MGPDASNCATAMIPTPDGHLQDDELIRSAAAGSESALAELYRRHAELVHRTAYRFLRDAAAAEDVLQEVFIGLPEALCRFDATRPLEPWLRRVAARAALSRLRSGSRRRQRESLFARRESRAGHSPLDQLVIDQALERLPPGLRAVLLLREVEGYTHAEIGEMLGITPAASATRLSRAWALLRREMRGGG